MMMMPSIWRVFEELATFPRCEAGVMTPGDPASVIGAAKTNLPILCWLLCRL